jgi:hypothetical protein
MAALSAYRNTKQLSGAPIPVTLSAPQKGSTTIYQGALVCLNGGYLAPATAAAGLVVVGRALKTSVNSGSDAAVSALYEPGVFKWGNSAAGDAITAAHIGRRVYAVDDQTVALTSNAGVRSVAGVVTGVDSDGVWVGSGAGFGGITLEQIYAETATETVSSAGAVSPSCPLTYLDITGTTAYTLAAGIFKGQIKYVMVKAGASTPIGTVTPAAVSGFASVSALGAVGDFAAFRWNGSAWELAACSGVTVS